MLDPAETTPERDEVRAVSVEDADGRDVLRAARRAAAEGRPEQARRWATTVVDVTDDLSTWSGAGRVLAEVLGAAPLARRARVAVLGSSTTAQLAALLPLACARAGLQIEVYEAPYGQYRQEVLDPSSPLYAFAPDVVVLALHEGDVDLPPVSPDPDAAVEAAVRQLESLWAVLASRTTATVAQFTMVVPPEQALGHLALSVAGSRARLLHEVNLRMAAVAPPSVVMVDVAALAASVGTRTWMDPRFWHMAKQAVNPRCIPMLARQVGAVLGAAAGLSRKCLVLDLDNTLWGGVLGEEGVHGIALGEGADGEAFTAFQDHVVALKDKGVVLAVCSKNDEPLVREAFEQHPGMRLTLDDIAVLSAGWDDKPSQLRRIAADLGLGLDSLVFVDDNPIERESVRQLAPEVDVVTLPPDPAGYVRALADYPYFQSSRLTDEDAARTAQYKARAEAASALAEASSLDDFLDSLEMAASVEPVGPTNLARVAQLVGKTNQFNLTGIRRTEAELEALVAVPTTVAVAARLSDRYADHGLVGVVVGRREDAVLELDTWLMSCRVIGRTLEDALLAVMAEQAREGGCTHLRGRYVPSAKNGLVADLYPRLGFTAVGPPAPDGTTTWELALGDVTPGSPHIRMDVPAPSERRIA